MPADNRQQTEEEMLRRSEQRFRLAAANMSDIVYEWTGTVGEIEDWREARDCLEVFGDIEAHSGYRPEELRSFRDWIAIIHPEDRARVAENAERAVLEFADEYRTVCRDGTVRHWVHRATAVPDGTGRRWIGALTDITERKRAEAMLRESEERFRFLFETMAHGILEHDGDGNVLDANPAACRICGMSLPDLRQRFPKLAFRGRNGASVAPDRLPWNAARTGRAVDDVLLSFESAPGDVRWVSVDAIPRTGAAGRMLVYTLLRDVTEREQMQSRLRTQRQRLRLLAAHVQAAREEERIRMARDIHDELGQMLMVLRLDAEQLPQAPECLSCPDRSELDSRLAAMNEHVAATIKSVKRILTELRPAALDHLGLAAAIEWQAGEFERRTGIRCDASGLANVKIGAGEAAAMFRIYQELLTNVARHANARCVTTRLAASHGDLVLTVRDDGRGIRPEEIHDRRGFGLLGIRERVRSFGGQVHFRGKPNKGTTVLVRIPIRHEGATACPRKRRARITQRQCRLYSLPNNS